MKTTCYLQIVPEWRGSHLSGFHVARITRTRPREPMSGCVVMQLGLDIPNKVFDPLLVAEIEVPERGLRVVPLVTVEEDTG